MAKKKIKISQILEAIEEDNIPLKRGNWFNTEKDGVIGAACILGQAAVNLGITIGSLTNILDKAVKGSSSNIISLNDSTSTPYPVMVTRAKALLKGYEDYEAEAETYFYISRLK